MRSVVDLQSEYNEFIDDNFVTDEEVESYRQNKNLFLFSGLFAGLFGYVSLSVTLFAGTGSKANLIWIIPLLLSIYSGTKFSEFWNSELSDKRIIYHYISKSAKKYNESHEEAINSLEELLNYSKSDSLLTGNALADVSDFVKKYSEEMDEEKGFSDEKFRNEARPLLQKLLMQIDSEEKFDLGFRKWPLESKIEQIWQYRGLRELQPEQVFLVLVGIGIGFVVGISFKVSWGIGVTAIYLGLLNLIGK